MRIVHVPADPPPAKPPQVAVVIGNFDGVHLGHRALLRRAIERAARMGLQSAVVTFDPHPRLVLRPDLPFRQLSPIEEKAELLAQLGIDHLLIWRFDEQTRQTSAEHFLEQLCRYLRVKLVLHGPGFALGRQRQGTPDRVAQIGQKLGFTLESLPAFDHGRLGGALAMSSSTIRDLVENGDVRRAALALGRPPTLTGVIVKGEQIGRTLSFPTANLAIGGPMAIPSDGVYAGWAEIAPWTNRSARHAAAISIGMRPQFGGLRRVVEAHLIDFEGDLYDQVVRLHLVDRLRDQQRFASVGALAAQIGRDVEAAGTLLASRAAWKEGLLLGADG